MSRANDESKAKPAAKQHSLEPRDEAAFRGFVNLNLSEPQKAEFDAWFETGGCWGVLEDSAAAGIQVSVKWSPKEKTFLASATQRRETSPNAGLVVTARGKTASKAWARVLYCVLILSSLPRWEATKPIADDDRW